MVGFRRAERLASSCDKSSGLITTCMPAFSNARARGCVCLCLAVCV